MSLSHCRLSVWRLATCWNITMKSLCSMMHRYLECWSVHFYSIFYHVARFNSDLRRKSNSAFSIGLLFCFAFVCLFLGGGGVCFLGILYFPVTFRVCMKNTLLITGMCLKSYGMYLRKIMWRCGYSFNSLALMSVVEGYNDDRMLLSNSEWCLVVCCCCFLFIFLDCFMLFFVCFVFLDWSVSQQHIIHISGTDLWRLFHLMLQIEVAN